MTRGNTTKHMLCFSIPLLVGNVFQQAYGAASSIVVGRYLGKDALAAMGTAIPVMNIVLFLLVGMTMGVSIIMAEFFGAGDGDDLKKELATSIFAGTIFTVALSLAGIACITPALRAINAPPEIVAEATAYLRVIFAGLAFAFLYNLLSSALRAVGESAAPLWFLIVSSLLNVALSILFVGKLGLGIRGAALATVASEAASVLCCVAYIAARVPALKLGIGEIRPEISLLSKTVSYSWVSGFQQMFVFAGVFLVQGAINSLGIDAIAAFNAASRIDGFVIAPSDSLALALMMFISQNKGANKAERIGEGLWKSFAINFAYTAFAALAIYIFAENMMAPFLDAGETGALKLGAEYMRTMCAFYLISSFCNALQGYFRGMGMMHVALYATFIQIPIRILLAYTLTARLGMNAVAVAIGVGWAFMAAYQAYEYKKTAIRGTVSKERVSRDEICVR